MNEYVSRIQSLLASVRAPEELTLCVLSSAAFATYPASCTDRDGRPPKHHGEKGGLARHTYEVLRFALNAAAALPRVDWVALAVGAVWHDFGKIEEYDYRLIDGEMVFTRRTPNIPHIVHGLMIWAEASKELHFDDPPLFEAVSHIIAAHHGRKEWGSPVEPKTVEALLVHQADMLSVMVETGTNPTSR